MSQILLMVCCMLAGVVNGMLLGPLTVKKIVAALAAFAAGYLVGCFW